MKTRIGKSKFKVHKPAPLRVVSAYFEPARGSQREYDNGLRPPCKLSKQEQRLWDQTVIRLPWLEPSDVYIAHAWVKEQARYLENGTNATAAQLARLQGLQSKLGLCPAARARLSKSRRPKLELLPAPERSGSKRDYFS